MALVALNVSLRRIERLANARDKIIHDEADDLAFIHTVLAQCGLPYRRQTARDYKRESGRACLVVSAGHLLDPKTKQLVPMDLPYGSKPRLVLLHLCTELVRTDNPMVDIGTTLSGFMKQLGLVITGGKNGTLRSFRQQLNNLAACRMQLAFRNNDNHTRLVNPAPVIREYDIWFADDPRQRVLWPSKLRVSDEFFEAVRKHACPLDMRAVKALKHNARSLDIYAWLANRLRRVRSTEGDRLSWQAVQSQFGGSSSNRKTFQNRFKEALSQTLLAYPQARVRVEPEGLLLLESPPPIGRRGRP